jgi:hypothetical protein
LSALAKKFNQIFSLAYTISLLDNFKKDDKKKDDKSPKKDDKKKDDKSPKKDDKKKDYSKGHSKHGGYSKHGGHSKGHSKGKVR